MSPATPEPASTPLEPASTPPGPAWTMPGWTMPGWTTPLAAEIGRRLVSAFTAAANPARAASMRAYMRDQFPFLGIPAPEQKTLAREILRELGRPEEPDLHAVALACWALPEREYQYFACAWLRRHARSCSAGFLATARHLIVTKSWWDTVDTLSVHLVGTLVARHPALASTMDEWVVEDNLWLVRAAILHQLGYKEATDQARLFHYCTQRSEHPDFFVRKAIGWALREYARTDPTAVHAYVRANQDRLAALSVREALKNIG